ncbi:MAG: CPBP family intramembrane metalloprotease [Alphaproteobacteria bacterium]|nr:MAG: CPBP family intramembrane metalloprotease [Alphaproteobacteria bacterium]
MSDWIAWLPLMAGLVVLQASGEEAVFRGYLVQQIARRTHSRVVLILLTSGLFGFLHIDPSFDEPQALAFMLLTFGFGAIACLLVIRTGSLSAAIGFHIAANWAALLVVGTELPGRGVTSLWAFDGSAISPLMLADGVALLATWIWLQSPLSPLLPAPAQT